MADLDLRHLLLPSYVQRFEDQGITLDTECEINSVGHEVHAYAPFDNGWQPNQPYGPSRAHLGYFDDLMPRKAGVSGAERAIQSLMRNGVVAERDWPTNASTYHKKPPASVIAKAVFPLKSYEKYNGHGYMLFDWINAALRAGKIPMAHLRLTDAIHDVGPDGIMPNRDTAHGYNHVVPLFGKLTKKGNPDWYGFRNHAGTGWGDNGDFYIHKTYLHRHAHECLFFILNFK